MSVSTQRGLSLPPAAFGSACSDEGAIFWPDIALFVGGVL
jgi:hypothetical protein